MAEPRFAYVVLCHHKAEQALRLAATIRQLAPRSQVLLRHDQSAGYIDAAQATAAGAALLISSRQTDWGSWSLVDAALEAFARAQELWDPDWFVLISGQDYPVRRLADWEAEVLASGAGAVVPATPLVVGPGPLRPRSDLDWMRMRYTHRWMRLPTLGIASHLPRRVRSAVRAVWYRFLYDAQALIVLNELPRNAGWALGLRRKFGPWSPATPIYKGDQWVALSRAALGVVTDAGNERWRQYFSTTLIPDEAYFPTVLHASAEVGTLNSAISWLRWEGDVSSPHPRTMTIESVGEATNSGAPFARKFDEAAGHDVLGHVDRNILGITAG